MSEILQLHPGASKSASEAAARHHIVARVREYQALKALAGFVGVPHAILPLIGPTLPVSPTDLLQQLEAYVQHRIALARADVGSA